MTKRQLRKALEAARIEADIIQQELRWAEYREARLRKRIDQLTGPVTHDYATPVTRLTSV